MDLDALESKRDKIATELAVLNPQFEAKKGHLAVLEAFEGLLQSASLSSLELFVEILPGVLQELKQGKHSPELARAVILQELTGGNLKVMKCKHCGARFYVDKRPTSIIGYHCPSCGTINSSKEDKDEYDILKAALARTEPKTAEHLGEGNKPIVIKTTPIPISKGNSGNKG